MLRRWVALAPNERVLLAAGTFWVVTARLALRWPGASFGQRQRALEAVARRLPRLRGTKGKAYWATTAAARRIPGTVCLPWALALHGLLLQAGFESNLCIGVAAGRASRIRAHAWLECGGETMSWNEPVGEYGVLGRSAA